MKTENFVEDDVIGFFDMLYLKNVKPADFGDLWKKVIVMYLKNFGRPFYNDFPNVSKFIETRIENFTNSEKFKFMGKPQVDHSFSFTWTNFCDFCKKEDNFTEMDFMRYFEMLYKDQKVSNCTVPKTKNLFFIWFL